MSRIFSSRNWFGDIVSTGWKVSFPMARYLSSIGDSNGTLWGVGVMAGRPMVMLRILSHGG